MKPRQRSRRKSPFVARGRHKVKNMTPSAPLQRDQYSFDFVCVCSSFFEPSLSLILAFYLDAEDAILFLLFSSCEEAAAAARHGSLRNLETRSLHPKFIPRTRERRRFVTERAEAKFLVLCIYYILPEGSGRENLLNLFYVSLSEK